jgi:hypothetical protein
MEKIKEVKVMKRFWQGLLMAVVFSLVIGSFYSLGWAQHDPIDDEWNTMDLLIARPASAVAGAVGTVLFVITLPFTVPTQGVEESADMFIVRPFRFAFEREFPDEDMRR